MEERGDVLEQRRLLQAVGKASPDSGFAAPCRLRVDVAQGDTASGGVVFLEPVPDYPGLLLGHCMLGQHNSIGTIYG